MELTGAALPIPEGVAAEIERQFSALADAGPTMTGAERVEVAATARAAMQGEPAAGTDQVGRAATRIATEAHTITQDWIDTLAADGVGTARYIEILGVVARLSAVDTAVRGLGADEVPLPAPTAGEPTARFNDEAKKRSAFIPTVGAANPVSVLSMLPSELELQLSLSGAIYLSLEQMMDMDIRRELHRTQIELVAARTSRDNECFY